MEGRRQGCTKKDKGKSSLTVCKRELFKSYLLVIDQKKDITYANAKALATDYVKKSDEFKDKLGSWTIKDPSLLNFTL